MTPNATRVGAALLAATLAIMSPGRVDAGDPMAVKALALVEAQVRDAFPDVSHLPAAAVADLIATQGERIVLLDVRTSEEFAVSRIPRAIAVEPNARRTTSIVAAAGGLEGKIVVAYCSIGLRSARLLLRIGPSLRDRGAVALHNLEGGIFRWRNEERDLEGPAGATQDVHAYNVLWRQLLLRPASH